jgi:hypothetical protein
VASNGTLAIARAHGAAAHPSARRAVDGPRASSPETIFRTIVEINTKARRSCSSSRMRPWRCRSPRAATSRSRRHRNVITRDGAACVRGGASEISRY